MTKRVVFMTGAGHSGSTLLGLLLSSHSKVFGLGELANIYSRLNEGPPGHQEICSICLNECDFWNRSVNLPKVNRFYSRKGIFSSLTRWVSRYQENPYSYFLDWSGTDVVVDFSKSPVWIRQQLWPSRNWQNITPYLLFITRDGRAVVNSYLRKHSGRTIEQQSKYWAETMNKCQDFYDNFPGGQKMMVSYEQLTTETTETLQSLCQLLNLEYEPDMLHYWAHDHHIVSSNKGTRSLIWRYRQDVENSNHLRIEEQLQRVSEKHNYHYDKLGLAINIDLRWRQELSVEQVDIFEKVAGEVNKRFSFDGTGLV